MLGKVLVRKVPCHCRRSRASDDSRRAARCVRGLSRPQPAVTASAGLLNCILRSLVTPLGRDDGDEWAKLHDFNYSDRAALGTPTAGILCQLNAIYL